MPLLAAGVRIATPLLFAGLGEAVAERSGVLNVGVDGMIAIGAYSGFAAAVGTDHAWLGLLAGAGAGLVAALLFGWLTVLRGADQVVTGVVFNILALGAASSAYQVQFGSSHDVPELPALALYRVPWLSVLPARMQAVAFGGAMAGLGGATISVAQVGAYVDSMVAGRGFIALAVVVFGRWRAGRVAAACLLLGVAEALQLRLQITRTVIPAGLLVGLPYLLTIVVVSFAAWHNGYPAAINHWYPPPPTRRPAGFTRRRRRRAASRSHAIPTRRALPRRPS